MISLSFLSSRSSMTSYPCTRMPHSVWSCLSTLRFGIDLLISWKARNSVFETSLMISNGKLFPASCTLLELRRCSAFSCCWTGRFKHPCYWKESACSYLAWVILNKCSSRSRSCLFFVWMKIRFLRALAVRSCGFWRVPRSFYTYFWVRHRRIRMTPSYFY